MRRLLGVAAIVLWAGLHAGAQAQPALSSLGEYDAQTRASMSPADVQALDELSSATVEFDRGNYRNVIEILTPAIKNMGFQALMVPTQYAVLGLYSGALVNLGAGDKTRQALISLAVNSTANP